MAISSTDIPLKQGLRLSTVKVDAYPAFGSTDIPLKQGLEPFIILGF